MCAYQGKPVGEYCSCCHSCDQYLSVCVPVVGYGGYAVGECDFDFCSYCPVYETCEEVWGKDGDGMKLMNYSLEYLIECNTPPPPRQPYTDCQYRILCEVIRRRKVTKEYFYTLIGKAYHCQSVKELDYAQMYRVIWILNHWNIERKEK